MYNLGIQISMSCSADHGLNVLFLFSFNFLPSLLTKTLHDQYSYPAFPDFFFPLLSFPYYISYSIRFAFVAQILEIIEMKEV